MTSFIIRSACALSLVAGLGACTNPGVAITNRAMDAQENNAYNEYLKNAGQINLEREKAGLSPAPVLTRDEWRGHR